MPFPDLVRENTFYVYHGTDEYSAIGIIGEGFTCTPDGAKQRDDHWLGDGLYFYREDPESAMIWSVVKIQRTPELHGQKAAVLESKVKICNTNFLNLDSREGLLTLEKEISEIQTGLEQKGITLEFEDKNDAQVRHFIFNSIPADKYPVIQRTFRAASKRFDENSTFKNMDLYLYGQQICVRNTSALCQQPLLVGTKKVFIPPSSITSITKNKRKNPKIL